MTKYKLRCFRCHEQFISKKEVYRDYDNNPCCRDCFEDLVSLDIEPQEWILDLIRDSFGGSINKYLAYLETCIECETCGFLFDQDDLEEYKGHYHCQGCLDEMLEVLTVD